MEIQQVSDWARANNLRLNMEKSCEIILSRRGTCPVLPPIVPNLRRVDELKLLGVTFDHNLSFHRHIECMVAKGAQSLFGLNVLKTHGLRHPHLSRVTRSSLHNRLLYASPAWLGFISEGDRHRLFALGRKAVRWGLYRGEDITMEGVSLQSDKNLFRSITKNHDHVLRCLLPPVKPRTHNLRVRPHPFKLTAMSSWAKRNFINRMLFKESY